PFGGVNVIFTGDFGQLKPVMATALFSHSVVDVINNRTAQTPSGQSSLHGALLWRQVTKVIELKKNWRARKDPA
ncbi:hypothetical protein BJ138DRAFT_977759, partial [Hygrophoropsis aurantiaca]